MFEDSKVIGRIQDRLYELEADPEHREDCPANENNRGDDALCLCDELNDADFQDHVDRKYDEGCEA